MPEEVTYDEALRLIRVRAWGEDTIEDIESSKAQIIKLNKTTGATSLLVDLRELGSTASDLEIFQFTESWPQHIRVAILSSQAIKGEAAFMETVAVNRGKQILVFEAEEAALEWLAQNGSADGIK